MTGVSARNEGLRRLHRHPSGRRLGRGRSRPAGRRGGPHRAWTPRRAFRRDDTRVTADNCTARPSLSSAGAGNLPAGRDLGSVVIEVANRSRGYPVIDTAPISSELEPVARRGADAHKTLALGRIERAARP